VRDTWRGIWGEAGFENRWAMALEAGVVADSASPEQPVRLRAGWDLGASPPAAAGLTAIFAPDPGTWDGSFAENAWLQEMPRPLTKIAWGNAALLAPATATALGLAAGDEVMLELGGRRMVAPVWPVPGHAPGCVTLPLGGGRTAASGEVGAARGFDAHALRTAATPWVAPGLTLRPTGQRAAVIATQFDRNRDSTDAARTLAPGEGFPPSAQARSLYPEWRYEGHAWGMTVDLDACIGCNACAVACQAENNVPVVGPREMARGREMHWLRIDLYQQGEEAAPDTLFQPVPCMHCEKAPCEVVCPVNATVHDHEGLNVMVYPRCIGTRTCSNNCPYKIRRFNWFDYARAENGVMVRNPDVPLRPRGVIEKCTYCTHRIAAARAQARHEDRPIGDGDIETACQRACPTRAIIFGDVNDPDSAVSVAKREGRNYALLGQLDTRPRTTYLARVRPEDTA
jgi:molybdopterin-containing oxidoreductase family iron-sulfur binding subunit